MVYRRKHRKTLDVAVPTRTGWIKRSTGTTDRATARAMERMLAQLGPYGARAWDLLEAVLEKRLSLGALFDAYRNEDLDGLRGRLTDVDLAAHIPSWEAWLTDRVKPTTADHYRAHLRTLIPDGQPFWRSGFTAPAVARWLAARTALVAKRRRSPKTSRRQPAPPPRPVSASTKRRYLAAVQSFVSYLREMGVLTTNPLRDLQAPPPGPPRCQFLELPDVVRLVEGSARPYRAIFALAYGAGLEISAILAGTESDVDRAVRSIRARGTKAWNRATGSPTSRIGPGLSWNATWPRSCRASASFVGSTAGRLRTTTGNDSRHSGCPRSGSMTAATIGPWKTSGLVSRSNSSRGSSAP